MAKKMFFRGETAERGGEEMDKIARGGE